jgi:hypothetical protein
MKTSRLQAALGLLCRPTPTTAVASRSLTAQTRCYHPTARQGPLPIPQNIPFVPDVTSYLTLIGRGLRKYADKFPSWDALFSLSSVQLKELGVEPARTRRYLLNKLRQYREGEHGLGHDFKYVDNGTAELKVLEEQVGPLLYRRRVVNVPLGKKVKDIPADQLCFPKGYHVEGIKTICGPHALPAKNGRVLVKLTEGMWEHKRGHKVDGGERRRAEVRFKRRVKERRERREKEGYY